MKHATDLDSVVLGKRGVFLRSFEKSKDLREIPGGQLDAVIACRFVIPEDPVPIQEVTVVRFIVTIQIY